MLVAERPGSGPREIRRTRDAGAPPLLRAIQMIITPHATEGDPLTDTLAIDSRRHGMSLHLPLFRAAICMLLNNGNYDPPLYPAYPPLVAEGHAHAHEATAITIGRTSVTGPIVTEVVLGVAEVVLLSALPPNHKVSKVRSHLARHPTDSSEANP
jgi:hypothetical protein